MKKIAELRNIIKQKSIVTKDQQKIYGRDGQEQSWIFDIKKIILDPMALGIIVDIFWEKYEGAYPFQVGCQEVAAIPLVSAIVYKSQQSGKPVSGFFVRKSRKKDGLQKMIEGDLNDEKIVLVDDIINSGQTIDRQIKVIEEEGKKVSDVFSIVSFRDVEGYEFLKKKEIKLSSLFSVSEFGLNMIKEKKDIPHNYFNVLWRFQSPDPSYYYVMPKSTPAIDDKKVYFGSDSGYFWALNQSDGSVAWKYRVWWLSQKGIFSSPALFQGNVYFGAYDGNVYCLDKKTGKRKWVFMEADWVGSSPAIAENLGLLFVGLEFGLFRKKGGIAALNAKTGKKIWEYKMSEFVHCSPVYLEKKKMVAIGGNDGKMYLLDAKSGRLIWSYQTGGEIKYSPTVDSENKIISFGSMDGNLYVLDVDSGKLVYKYKTEAGIYSKPLIIDESVIFSSLDKMIYSLDLAKKELNWVFDTSGRVFSSPALIGENIFVGSNDGRMYELEKQKGTLCSFFQFTERITNEIVFNAESKRFFVLTQANELYCLARQFSTNLFAKRKSDS